MTDLAAPAAVEAPFTDPRFRPLVQEFRALFTKRRGGGALAVYQHGRPVVDVWAGYADIAIGRPWTAETTAMSFSTSKGVASTLVHRLIQRGVLDVAEPIATWWPEFAANGKGATPIADVRLARLGAVALQCARG